MFPRLCPSHLPPEQRTLRRIPSSSSISCSTSTWFQVALGQGLHLCESSGAQHQLLHPSFHSVRLPFHYFRRPQSQLIFPSACVSLALLIRALRSGDFTERAMRIVMIVMKYHADVTDGPDQQY